MEHERSFIENRNCLVFDDTVTLHIAKEGDFVLDALLQRLIGAGDNDIGENTGSHKFLDRVLGGLALMLGTAFQIRDQRDMNEEAIGASDFVAELPDRLQKRLAFDVTGGSPISLSPHRPLSFGQ
jgi:hypothetical protein